VETGLHALASVDTKLIAEVERAKFADSLDLDEASKGDLPDSPRWDYLLSLPEEAQIIGLEPHTARDAEISVVIAKKEIARTYLRSHFLEGRHVARWIWVSHGTVGFSRMEVAQRRLAQRGIEFTRRLTRVGRSSD